MLYAGDKLQQNTETKRTEKDTRQTLTKNKASAGVLT